MSEEILAGGNLSVVVRVGDTVRRRTGPWTPAVHALLRHLERAGFSEAPRVRGIDEQSREVLDYVEGFTLGWPLADAPFIHTEETLTAAARLLRRYHDAAATFAPPAGAAWRIVAPGRFEVVCHNDMAPYNTVFREERPIAMIDWDLAGPAPRLWDVAWAAVTWVPLYGGDPAYATADLARRLRSFCDAYGLEERRDVVATIRERQLFGRELIARLALEGDAGFAKLAGWGIGDAILRHVDWLDDHRAELEAALA
ncbi:MAG: phosphotransferase [Chloroflexota bacterium]|nr:phosphotransferase [Chloroflexota bacterium]